MKGVKQMERQGGRGWKGRGFRPNHTFIESRRPGEHTTRNVPSTTMKEYSRQNVKTSATNLETIQTDTEAVRFLVKYSYQANDCSPLGLAELTIQQGQKVTFIKKHSDNDQWCCIQMDDGKEGYVPTSYLMELESKPSLLPWLQKTMDTEEKADNKWGGTSKPIFKPYVPTYQENKYEVPDDLKRFYCKVCNKQLNGIVPYNAHMSSKAHKEELQYYEEEHNS